MLDDIYQVQQAPHKAPGIVGDQATLDRVAAAEHPECLMCSPTNSAGMKLRFRVQADGSVAAVFPCRHLLQSYPDTLHGGVVSALFDAAMVNALFSINIVAVTAELTVRFLAPVNLDRGAVVRAVVESTADHPLYKVSAELKQDQQLKARATAKFLVRGCI